MRQRRTYQIKEAAQIAGVSVRTLHHYDEIGLLVPKGRSAGGYRLYDDSDLLRLQQILIGRELGLALHEIGRSLDDPQFDLQQALRSQRQQLQQRAGRTQAMIRAVDAALAILATEDSGVETVNMSKIFDGFDPSQHEEEVQQRWGGTEAYRESKQRTSRYTAADWSRYRSEQSAVYAAAVAAMSAGRRSDDPQVLNIAERHRLLIDRWFYPCSLAMHRGLADMYEADSRFSENIDKHGKGLTAYLAAAIRANADRTPAAAGY